MNAWEETKGSRNDKDLSAKNHGQELVESDVLDLCRVDVTSLLITRLSRMEKVVTGHLEDRLVVPVGVDPPKLHSQPVHKKIDSTTPRFQMFTEK